MTTRLFHISDVHFGVEDTAALAAVTRAVAQERPDALLCTGDVTQRATHHQYARARTWFAALGVPVMLQPGNHDMPYFNLWERFAHPYARFDRLEAAVGSKLELEHAVIVPFDTNVAAQPRWPWSDGVVVRRKLDAALSQLRALENDSRMKLVACHHPLLAKQDDRKNPTIGGDLAFAELAAAGADAVLSGHVHQPFDMMRSRAAHTVRMIGAGTLSTRLRGVAPSFNVVTISSGQKIKVERRDFSLEDSESGTDGWLKQLRN